MPVRPSLAMLVVLAACARGELPLEPAAAPSPDEAPPSAPQAEEPSAYVTPTEASTPPACGWAPVGTGLTGGNVADARYDPRVRGRAFAATGLQVYRSLDHGRTWALLAAVPASVRQFAFPAGAPEVVLAASASGLLRSSDGGLTWATWALGGLGLTTLTVHPAQPERLYASAVGAGILASQDGGRSWSTLTRGLPATTFQWIVVDPADPRRVLASGDNDPPPGGGTYRSTTQGAWVTARTDRDRPLGLAQCDTDPALVYAGHSDGVFRSRDFGATWEPVFTALGSTGLAVTLAPGACDKLYVTAANGLGVGFYFSDDGGATFSPLAGGDIPFAWKSARSLSVDPADPRRALGASHAGILLTEDGTRSFTVAQGLRGLRGAVTAGADGGLWLSTWGSGAWHRPPGAQAWGVVPGSLDFNFSVTPDPRTPARALVFAWPRGVVADGGAWTTIDNVPNLLTARFLPDTDALVGGSQVVGIVRSEDRGVTWAPSNAGLPEPWATRIGNVRWVNSLAVSTRDPGRVVAGTEGRGLFLSTDGGRNWSATAPELAGEVVTPVVYGPATGFVAMTAALGTYRSDDGVAWTRVDGLPAAKPAPMAIDEAGTLYVAASGGISRGVWQGGAVDWTPFGETCRPAGIVALATHGGRLFASVPGYVYAHDL